jgi:LysM repeat protein
MQVILMSKPNKVAEAMRRSIPLLPGEAKEMVLQMLKPESLALITATLIVWAGSHFLGIGEIVDVILLLVGFATLGASAFEGAKELYAFAQHSTSARSEEELDLAAHHFARAVNILGITIIMALLMRKAIKDVNTRGPIKINKPSLPKVGPAPEGGVKPVSYVTEFPDGRLGECDWFGNISILKSIEGTPAGTETLYHEWVHKVLSPRLGPLRELRAAIKAAAYYRSALLAYIEEAMAESVALLAGRGLSWQNFIAAVKFPLGGGYSHITISALFAEGNAIGTILTGGLALIVSLTNKDYKSTIPKDILAGKPQESEPPQPTPAPKQGTPYTVQQGDTLSGIAKKFYGDFFLWPAIYDANKNVIGPNWNFIKPGQQYQIPDIKSLSPSQINELKSRGKNWK